MISSDSAFKTAIRSALCSCLNLASGSAEALSMIREAYTEPENSPRPDRSADVIYWSVSPAQDAGTDYAVYSVEQATRGSHKPAVSRFLPYQLLLVCYGPNCESHAHQIRSFLFVDGSGFPRSILRKAGIYLVPDPAPPLLLYEPEGTLWRRRADLTVSIGVTDTLVYAAQRNSIQSVPDIIIRR